MTRMLDRLFRAERDPDGLGDVARTTFASAAGYGTGGRHADRYYRIVTRAWLPPIVEPWQTPDCTATELRGVNGRVLTAAMPIGTMIDALGRENLMFFDNGLVQIRPVGYISDQELAILIALRTYGFAFFDRWAIGRQLAKARKIRRLADEGRKSGRAPLRVGRTPAPDAPDRARVKALT